MFLNKNVKENLFISQTKPSFYIQDGLKEVALIQTSFRHVDYMNCLHKGFGGWIIHRGNNYKLLIDFIPTSKCCFLK